VCYKLLIFSIYYFVFNIGNALQAQQDNILLYRQPAKTWLEALPLGNGKIGAMVYGNPDIEHLQLNEETLWAGCPEDPIPNNAREHYANFRQLNLEGKFEEALDYAMKHLAISPTSIRSYQPLGNLFISFDKHNKVENYKRELNLHTGVNTIIYTINGKRFVRESFISGQYNTLFYKFKSLDKEKTTCEIWFEREKDIKQNKIIKNNLLVIDGQIFDDPNGYDDNPDGSGKGGYHMKFASNIYVRNSTGKLQKNGQKLIITDTDEFVIMVTAATNYNVDIMNFDENIMPLGICNKTIRNVLNKNYTSIKAQHISRHSSVMNRVRFNITNGDVDTIPTDRRFLYLKNHNEDAFLTQLFFQFGRYLLLTSSEENSKLPANLQGIWNDKMWAAWESDFHLNINLQMNYWLAENCNLSETLKPLSKFMQNLSKKGKKTASAFLDTEGWFAGHVSNAFGRTTPSGSTKRSQVDNGYCFPLSGAWMSLTLWRHYEYTLDTLYLKNTAYPILSGAAKFALDILSENEKGELVTSPSYSPENTYIHPTTGKHLRNTLAAALDIQIIKDLFDACLKSESILQQKTQLSERISQAIQKLPKTKIGKDGTIQEWYEDYEEAEIGHRHVSHLFALYPSNQINKNTPELFQAAKKTIEKRLSAGGGQTGWSRAWMIGFFARLHLGDESHSHISALLKELVAPNLFNLHPPGIFQIDGNLAATAGIAEMLFQSAEPGVINILPALPSKWKDGYITGLKAKGGITLDIYWSDNLLDKVHIKSQIDQNVDLIYNGSKVKLKLDKNTLNTFKP
jgi:alpha-L-fucosidase 2